MAFKRAMSMRWLRIVGLGLFLVIGCQGDAQWSRDTNAQSGLARVIRVMIARQGGAPTMGLDERRGVLWPVSKLDISSRRGDIPHVLPDQTIWEVVTSSGELQGWLPVVDWPMLVNGADLVAMPETSDAPVLQFQGLQSPLHDVSSSHRLSRVGAVTQGGALDAYIELERYAYVRDHSSNRFGWTSKDSLVATPATVQQLWNLRESRRHRREAAFASLQNLPSTAGGLEISWKDGKRSGFDLTIPEHQELLIAFIEACFRYAQAALKYCSKTTDEGCEHLGADSLLQEQSTDFYHQVILPMFRELMPLYAGLLSLGKLQPTAQTTEAACTVSARLDQIEYFVIDFKPPLSGLVAIFNSVRLTHYINHAYGSIRSQLGVLCDLGGTI